MAIKTVRGIQKEELNMEKKLRKVELQRRLCKELLAKGQKEDARKLWNTIKEIEKEIYCK